MNFDEIEKLLKQIIKKESGFNSPLPEEQKINLCNKVMISAVQHKMHTNQIANVTAMIPDLKNESVNDVDYRSFMDSMSILIRLYKQNKKQAEDVIFLLQWYQRECKNNYGKAS